MADKYFSRREAEELLPMIEEFLNQVRVKKQAVDSLQGDLSKAASRIMMLGGSAPAYADLAKKKSECTLTSAQIMESINEIQRTGCLVKDLDQGLVDFPTRKDGQEAYLCWKLGEKHIEWWHGIEEGFAGRKRLDELMPEEPPPPGRIQ